MSPHRCYDLSSNSFCGHLMPDNFLVIAQACNFPWCVLCSKKEKPLKYPRPSLLHPPRYTLSLSPGDFNSKAENLKKKKKKTYPLVALMSARPGRCHHKLKDLVNTNKAHVPNSDTTWSAPSVAGRNCCTCLAPSLSNCWRRDASVMRVHVWSSIDQACKHVGHAKLKRRLIIAYHRQHVMREWREFGGGSHWSTPASHWRMYVCLCLSH